MTYPQIEKIIFIGMSSFFTSALGYEYASLDTFLDHCLILCVGLEEVVVLAVKVLPSTLSLVRMKGC